MVRPLHRPAPWLAALVTATFASFGWSAAMLRAEQSAPRGEGDLARAQDTARVALSAEDIPPDTLPAVLPSALPLGLERFAEAPKASEEVVALGRALFFEPALSGDRTLACASCHRPDHGFAEPRATSIGIRGQDVGRNAPSLFNHALSTRVLWDGRADSLEHQVRLVIEAEKEMGLPLLDAVARLKVEGDYAARFEAAFGGELSADHIATAVAAFVRRLTLGDSPVDRFRTGDIAALDSHEENGMWLFEGRGRCWKCHVGPNFSDEGFHNTGVGATLVDGAEQATPIPGRAAVTGDARDLGRMRTPGLRGVALSPPYMHDGSLATLEDVVAFYRRGGSPNSNLSPHIAPIEMTDEEAQNLVAFLRALSR
ncbi:MAG: cytochrome c peroxidase [Planctomycetota bacterium]